MERTHVNIKPLKTPVNCVGTPFILVSSARVQKCSVTRVASISVSEEQYSKSSVSWSHLGAHHPCSPTLPSYKHK